MVIKSVVLRQIPFDYKHAYSNGAFRMCAVKIQNQLNDEAQSIHTGAAATVGAHFAAQPPWSSVNNST
jgi:hypothetical protein